MSKVIDLSMSHSEQLLIPDEKLQVQSSAENFTQFLDGRKFSTVLADPPWRFNNRNGKISPEHKRLNRYETMHLDEIKAINVASVVNDPAHLYLWVPNALIDVGLDVMETWGFKYKTHIVWFKTRKDGGPDGRGCGFYFRNCTQSPSHCLATYPRPTAQAVLSEDYL